MTKIDMSDCLRAQELLELRDKLLKKKGLHVLVCLHAIDCKFERREIRAERELLKSPTLFYPFDDLRAI